MSANAHTNGYTNGAAARPLRDKVEFPVNEPVVLKLDYDDGQLTPGRFGDQYQYTFDQGTRITWLDPEVRDLILRSGAAAGDEIAITKREIKGNNGRKRAQWEVEKVEDHTSLGPTPQEIAAAERAEAQARAQAQREEAERLARARPEAQKPGHLIEGQGPPCVAASRQQPAPAKPAPASDPRTEIVCRMARDFADCLMAAVGACQLSQAEAQKIGFNLPWDAGDVRAIGTSMYINRTKGGN